MIREEFVSCQVTYPKLCMGTYPLCLRLLRYSGIYGIATGQSIEGHSNGEIVHLVART